ncbi:MAG TPA: helix-turn-helix domain-containing protein [Solirubrobacteraceae bacterium]|nr:helix-turn-helix domain-containing protein [Solirubrobacteraceae bacterium]
MSHPLRMRLLVALEQEATSPKALAEKLQLPIGTVAYHVKTLHNLGLLTLDHTRQRRGAVEHYYRALEHPRFTDEAWSRLDLVSKQRVLAAVLTQAHEDAVRAAAAGGFDAADAHFTRTPLRLDAVGWAELAEVSKRWLDEAARIQDESDERIADGADGELGAELVVLLFETADSGAPDEVPQPARSTGSSM